MKERAAGIPVSHRNRKQANDGRMERMSGEEGKGCWHAFSHSCWIESPKALDLRSMSNSEPLPSPPPPPPFFG
ncbi:hypothetical protein, unlikely [Trypanosoma brucei gambiense DAL972]|uniref:Uncharacterized protein n=1 Tax=Trypanosoma brucei gambiense (strain MHOM/CI/86/DAL972) TaxID=679716 RepID=C9ZJ19_TRYB9|nr:hypothetical protein, unlikely [Trypanosoma brucei gambiense DAL972]CBH09377.1 hypothetical protein, unlikely [Trypanosoma brucei gambiense DAL972]|eukprot:XP_011771683.1 hypothetical protein, unlikely [Trypanosoma brucei gambiense DAL972]